MMFDILTNNPNFNKHYIDRYFKLVHNIRSTENCMNEYSEVHHIIPSSMAKKYSNLKDHPWNSLRVSPRQHYILHWILSKACGGKMIFAFNLMSRHTLDGRDYKVSSKAYDYIRKNLKHSEETKLKISNSAKERWSEESFIEKETRRRNDPKYTKEVSKFFLNYYSIDENRKSRSEKTKQLWQNEEYRNKQSEMATLRWQNEEYRQKQYDASKELWDDERRKNASSKMMGECNHFYGKTHTTETKQKISNSQKGRKNSVETRNKISKANKGKPKPNGFGDKISLANSGKMLKEETKNKISNKAKIRCENPDYIKKISEAQKNRKRGICIHCSKEMDICNLKKYHNDKCKSKPDL